jgi:predicted nucleic-acid-binding protein
MTTVIQGGPEVRFGDMDKAEKQRAYLIIRSLLEGECGVYVATNVNNIEGTTIVHQIVVVEVKLLEAGIRIQMIDEENLVQTMLVEDSMNIEVRDQSLLCQLQTHGSYISRVVSVTT